MNLEITVGQRPGHWLILRYATPDQVEIETWLNASDGEGDKLQSRAEIYTEELFRAVRAFRKERP